MQPAALFGHFKDICSLIKVAETVSVALLGTYGKKNTLLLSIVFFPYPPVAFAGCGNKAAAFWALLVRDSIHRPEHKNRLRHSARGTGGPTPQPCTQGWTMYTIFAVDTKRQRERFYCGRLAGLLCRRPLYPSRGLRLSIHLPPVPWLEFNGVVCYFTQCPFINYRLAAAGSSRLSLVPFTPPPPTPPLLPFSLTLIFLFALIPFPTHGWLLSPTPPTSFVHHCRQLKKKRAVAAGGGATNHLNLN